MQHYALLFKTADGPNKLTDGIAASSVKDALTKTTQFVRDNFVSAWIVPNPMERAQGYCPPWYTGKCFYLP
jgi:hypothetical protein